MQRSPRVLRGLCRNRWLRELALVTVSSQQERRVRDLTCSKSNEVRSQLEADMICAAATPEAFRSEGREADLSCKCSSHASGRRKQPFSCQTAASRCCGPHQGQQCAESALCKLGRFTQRTEVLCCGRSTPVSAVRCGREVLKPVNLHSAETLSRKSVCERTSHFPGQTCPTGTVTGYQWRCSH